MCYPSAILLQSHPCAILAILAGFSLLIFFHTFCGDNVEVKSIAEPRLGGLDVRWLGGLAPRQGEGLPPTNEGVLSRGGGEYWRMDG